MKEIEKSWVEIGYCTFALKGPNGLKVERISKEVGKNKFSFYHLFADLEVFTTILLDYHLAQSRILAKKESDCSNLEELINVLVVHKTDLLFSRPLRIHRESVEFRKCFLKVNEISMPSIIPIWSDIIGLKGNSYLAELALQLSLENFFLQITDETLNPHWLLGYFQNIKNLVKHFKMTGTVNSLDGNV